MSSNSPLGTFTTAVRKSRVVPATGEQMARLMPLIRFISVLFPELGRAISGVNEVSSIPNVRVFHANTRRTPEGLITAGGRVLNIVASAQTVADARALAYEAASHIHFGGIHYRRDVAQT